MFPTVLTPFTYPRGFQTRRVNTSGDISWHKDRVFISQVFSFEDLDFEEMDEDFQGLLSRDRTRRVGRDGVEIQTRESAALALV
jgi:hypothetical protein